MNRALLIKAADLAETASTYATLTASHANLKPEQAERYARVVEDTLYQALDALAEARMGQAARPDVMKALAPIIEILNPERRAA